MNTQISQNHTRALFNKVLLALCAIALYCSLGNVVQAASAPYVRIDLRYPGVYKVTGADLVEAGVDLGLVKPGALALYSSGTLVSIRVDCATSGSFALEDSIEFVGDSPRGDSTWFMQENKGNVYFLTWSGAGVDGGSVDGTAVDGAATNGVGVDEVSVRGSAMDGAGRTSADMTGVSVEGGEVGLRRFYGGNEGTSRTAPRLLVSKAAPAAPASVPLQRFWQWRHVEKNYVFWFSTLTPADTDNFFWSSFTAGQTPKDVNFTALDFPGFDKSAGAPAEVGLHVFGATNATGLKPSHRFAFLVDGKPVGEFQFDGVALHDAEFLLPPELIGSKPLNIAFDTPADRLQAVDKIFLDWITLRYPSSFNAEGREYTQLNNDLTTDTASTETLYFSGLPAGGTIFDEGTGTAWELAAGQTSAAIPNSPRLTTYTVVAADARLKVDQMRMVTSRTVPADLPEDISALLIYHSTLQATADAYVAYRRERGLKVAAVSVRDIFDQLNDGYISDVALKQYIAMVHERAPDLTHLVLLGDAYFDFREARSVDDKRQYEVLIPIHWVVRPGVSWSGGYQDDNWYGSFANEFRPDLAVGRIPVNTDAEGMEYLRKVVEYEVLRNSANDPGLMISSVEQSFQNYVTEIATEHEDKLSSYTYLFPKATDAPQEVATLGSEINKGKQLLYYVGHGGSLVWRVGPVDFAQQKDLFTPADVHKLTNWGHYPVVICASCYTTAFDQPESIGEALTNKPGGGAIAVIGAPWKATVQESHAFNRLLFQFYFDANVKTLGEASLKAHQEHISPEQKQALYNSFTLLGDPCLEIVR